jgi:hypothetical protein
MLKDIESEVSARMTINVARARTGLGRARGGVLRLLVMGDTRVQALRVSAGSAQSRAEGGKQH